MWRGKDEKGETEKKATFQWQNQIVEVHEGKSSLTPFLSEQFQPISY